jgi:AbiU2
MSNNVDSQKKLIWSAVTDLNKEVDALKYLLQANTQENQTTISIFDQLLGRILMLLWKSIVIDISWLFDEKDFLRDKKKNRSLFWYSDQVRSASPLLANKLDEQFNKFSELQDEYKKFRRIRDKWLVHREKISFEKPEEFWEGDLPNIKDVDRFLEIANAVIQVDGEKVDITPSVGIGKLFLLLRKLEQESPEFNRIVIKYGFRGRKQLGN